MTLLFRGLRGLRHYPWDLALIPVACLVVAFLTARAGWRGPTAFLLTVGAAAAAMTSAWWAARYLAPPTTVRAWVDRRDEQAHRAGGVASWLDQVEHTGRRAVRARARHLRPSLAGLSRWQLRAVPVTAYAVQLLRPGGPRLGSLGLGAGAWSTCEEVTLRIGGPRSGKSGSLACHILDAPGAVLVTTSRTDLLEATAQVRSRTGRVEVFNPTGLGGLASTVRWSPLAGCTDLATATRRAGDLIPPSTGDSERWDAQARALLAVLLHAAALAGGRLATVLDWISPADDIALGQVLTALRGSPSAAALAAELRSVYGANDRTLTSITTTMLPAIRWVTDQAAAAAGDAALDDEAFLDVADLVAAGTDSLYLIGRDDVCRRLIGALTAEVAHQVRMHAAARPGGRLDPPMTAVLDEAPLTCGPIPLHDWTSDMGGRGLTLHIGAQSLAQLRDVWGPNRAETILGNTGSLLVFGGLKTGDDLQRISLLTNTRMVRLDEDDVRPIPVMTPGDLAALPTGTALLIRTGTRPIIGRAPMAWDRDRRRATRRLLATPPPPATSPVQLADASPRPEPAAPEPVTAEPPALRAVPDDDVLADLDRWLDQAARDTDIPGRDGWDAGPGGGDAA